MGRAGPQPALIGAMHRVIADHLVELYADVAAGNGSAAVILAGGPGQGKTRIVQELYLRLARQQQADRSGRYVCPREGHSTLGATFARSSRPLIPARCRLGSGCP
jgi:hypothetical protein